MMLAGIAKKHLVHWQRYVSVFTLMHGRPPMVVDLCCGEGGFSRGARLGGVRCYGFDNLERHQDRYENDYGVKGCPPMSSGMTFTLQDVAEPQFWDDLITSGHAAGLPAAAAARRGCRAP